MCRVDIYCLGSDLATLFEDTPSSAQQRLWSVDSTGIPRGTHDLWDNAWSKCSGHSTALSWAVQQLAGWSKIIKCKSPNSPTQHCHAAKRINFNITFPLAISHGKLYLELSIFVPSKYFMLCDILNVEVPPAGLWTFSLTSLSPQSCQSGKAS